MIQDDMTNVEKVRTYIQKFPQTPLHFPDQEDEIKFTGSMNKLVTEILNKVELFPSKNVNNHVETWPGRRRSVLDIWRHVQFYKPDTTIFAVMRCLFRLGEENLTGCVCKEINRRTFRLKCHHLHLGLGNMDELDEFGLVFEDWKEIGRKKKRAE
jgi:hypothetical protein